MSQSTKARRWSTPAPWITPQLAEELKVIQATFHSTEKESDLRALESIIYSDFCKDVWENSKQLTDFDKEPNDGQIWLAHAILKAIEALHEEKTDAEIWRDDLIDTANKLRKKLRVRPKEKLVSECESTAKRLDKLVEKIKKKFKTTKFSVRRPKGKKVDRKVFTKKLILEYIKRNNNEHIADVIQIINTIAIDDTKIFNDIEPSNARKMAKKVRADLPELTAGPALNIKSSSE